jgi:WD40 repeat protein
MDATNVSTAMEGEHDSNVFCLDFDVGSRRVFSGGNDEKILVHDIATAKFVNQYLLEEPVFGISCHPGRSKMEGEKKLEIPHSS